MNRRPKAFCSNIHTYSALLCLVVIFAVVLADVVYVVASEAVLVAIDIGVGVGVFVVSRGCGRHLSMRSW